jgi:hypothetical protein
MTKRKLAVSIQSVIHDFWGLTLSVVFFSFREEKSLDLKLGNRREKIRAPIKCMAAVYLIME